MAKQKCGTCRFFQDAGLAGSGWCHHPQRKVSSDVMIMVRQNELACRDEWSRSLWAPGEGAGEAEKPFQRPPILGPAPPASVEHVRKMLANNALDASSPVQGEDVLLSEARIVSEVLGSPALKERPAPGGGFDPRTAVFRAREAYRERARARESAARHSAGVEAAGARLELGASEATTSDVERRAVVSVAGEPPLEPHRYDPRQAPRESYTLGTASCVATEGDERAATDDGDGLFAAEAEETWVAIEEPASADLEPALHLTRLNELDETNLPAWFRTDLPRICRTCRDFRPSAEGGRGWCANAWAFTHRRLVQEDDVAPCDSSIGDWWAPIDDVWLVAADVSSHGRATPLLDRLTTPQTERRRRS